METIYIEQTRIFVKVVQYGGFTKAAQILKVPKSTVSKVISKLEKETGTKLLVRTTRVQALTVAGRAFYEKCYEAIHIIEEAQKALYGQDSLLTGKIRITAPEDIGNQLISPIVGKISKKHSKLHFELHYTNEIVDLVKEGFDLAIRVGKLNESSLKAKKIGNLSMVLVASQNYLDQSDKITSPKDLENHDCLSISGSSISHIWLLKKEKEINKVVIKPKLQSNQMRALVEVALTGAGVALVPSFLCEEYIRSDQLRLVLSDWIGASIPVSIVTPIVSNSSARLKLISEEISSYLKKTLE